MMPIAAPAPVAPSTDQRRRIRPRHPFVFAFAMGDAPAPVASIDPGEIVLVDVPGGDRRSHNPSDWFAARVPDIPPVTGPLHVNGVAPGDSLEVEVLAVEPRDAAHLTQLAVAVEVAGSGFAPGRMQTMIPASGMAPIPAQRSGGLISVGPVLARRHAPGDEPSAPVAATVSVRVIVWPPGGR